MDNNVTNQPIWRDKNMLVMHKNATLPYRCIKTNKVTAKRVKLRLFCHHPASFFSLLEGSSIGSILMRDKPIVYLPVSEKIVSKRKKRILNILVLAIVGVVLLVMGTIFSNATLMVISLLLLLLAIIWRPLAISLVTLYKVDSDHLWLKGVCGEYLKEFPNWNKAVK